VSERVEPRRLSVREASERACVSTKVIRRAIERGELPGFRVRGTVKVVVHDVDVDRVFALERIEPRQPAPAAPPRRPAARRPPARGSREALRAIEGRANSA
jgi:excisionase family DNA binding protein